MVFKRPFSIRKFWESPSINKYRQRRSRSPLKKEEANEKCKYSPSKESIVDEEFKRLQLNDQRTIFVKRPKNSAQIENLTDTMKEFFRYFTFIVVRRDFIKLCYGKSKYQDSDLEKFKSKGSLYWSHNNEEVETLDPNNLITFNPKKYLYENDIIDTELVVRPFIPAIAPSPNLAVEFHKMFPYVKSVGVSEEAHKIILHFENAEDAFEAFQGGKEIEMSNWTVNLVYNRKNFDWEPNQSPIHDENPPMRSEEQVFGNEQDWSSIVTEETKRLRKGEKRKLYIQTPRETMSCGQLCYFLRSIFKGDIVIYVSHLFIKITYGRSSWKKEDLKFFNSRLFYWPHNRELVVIKDSTSIPEDSKFKNASLNDEIQETELVIHNVKTDVGYEELVKVFPNLKNFFNFRNLDKIELYFDNAKDALEAFHSGKDVLIGNWKTNVIFNRRWKNSNYSQSRLRSPRRNERFGQDRRSRSRSPLYRR